MKNKPIEERSDELLCLYEQALESYRHFDNFSSAVATILVSIASVVLGAGIIKSIHITFELYLVLSLILAVLMSMLLRYFLKVIVRVANSKECAIKCAENIEKKLKLEGKFRFAWKQWKIEKKSLLFDFNSKLKTKWFERLILILSGILVFTILISLHFWF